MFCPFFLRHRMLFKREKAEKWHIYVDFLMYFAAVFASGLQWYVASNTRIALCSNSGLLPFLSPRTQCWQVFEVAPSGTKWHQVAHSVLARIWSGTKWHTQLASIWSGTKWHQVAHSVLASIWSGTKWHQVAHSVLASIWSGTKWHQVAHSLSPFGAEWLWVAPSGTLTVTKRD